MATKQLSATVNAEVYEQFEATRKHHGLNRSQAIEGAIRLYLKACDDALIAEGCRRSSAEDLAIVKATRKKSLKALAHTL